MSYLYSNLTISAPFDRNTEVRKIQFFINQLQKTLIGHLIVTGNFSNNGYLPAINCYFWNE
jgi:hypothetical protein